MEIPDQPLRLSHHAWEMAAARGISEEMIETVVGGTASISATSGESTRSQTLTVVPLPTDTADPPPIR
jgi:hypothetical protein